MMSQQFLLYIALSIILLFASGCSSQSPSVIKPSPTAHAAIPLKAPIQFMLSAQQGKILNLHFLSSRDVNSKYNKIASLHFDDNNCTIGHQASISYHNSNEYLTRYFTNEIPWGKPHKLTIQWDNKNELQILLDDQKMNIPINRSVLYIAIPDESSFAFKRVET